MLEFKADGETGFRSSPLYYGETGFGKGSLDDEEVGFGFSPLGDHNAFQKF